MYSINLISQVVQGLYLEVFSNDTVVEVKYYYELEIPAQEKWSQLPRIREETAGLSRSSRETELT